VHTLAANLRAILTRLPALAGFALLLTPAAATPPSISPIHAEFVPSEFATHYTVTAQDPNAKALSYQWRLIPPTADPACNHFSATGDTAIWQNGDQDGCNHNVQVAQGHPGTVIVVVSDGEYSCTATYFGTVTGNGPAAACSLLIQATPSAVAPTLPADAGAHANAGIPAGQIVVAILVFLAVAGGVGWFLLARRGR